MVGEKDVVLAIIGTAATLSGATLIVLGILLAPGAKRPPYDLLGLNVGAFNYNLLAVVLAMVWLLAAPASAQPVRFSGLGWFEAAVYYFFLTILLDVVLVLVVAARAMRPR
jgi:hypothetical protein